MMCIIVLFFYTKIELISNYYLSHVNLNFFFSFSYGIDCFYFQEYDSVMAEWQQAGRRLALEMAELKECTSLSGSLSPLNRLLNDPLLRRTARDAEDTMLALEERAATLANVDYIR